jgi:hypothetical protein
MTVDTNRSFTLWEIIFIGVVSGVAVSLVKLIQWNFNLEDVSWVQTAAAGLTVVAYLVLGAIGAVFLVDHDARGQKMLKNAFLMGFVAPSFFLALLNNPSAIRPNFQQMIDRVPKLSELLIGAAHADEEQRTSEQRQSSEVKYWQGVRILEPGEVQPTFTTALKNALGWSAVPASYTYVLGTTDDFGKASATAARVNAVLHSGGLKDLSAFVVKPKGKVSFYITVGGLGTPDEAKYYAHLAKGKAFSQLPVAKTEEDKRTVALLLAGEIVDARAMFAKADAKGWR